MTTTPRWATAVRKARLVELWHRYGNRCLQGHRTCPERDHYVLRTLKPEWARVPDRMQRAERPDGTLILDKAGNPIYYQTYKLVPAPKVELSLERLYEVKSEEAIRHWVSEGAAQRAAEWKAERERLHRDQRVFRQGEFDSLRRQLYMENQPAYTIVALTVDSLTFRPVALVKVSHTPICLFVNLEAPMSALSKSARKRARRHGKALPEEAAKRAHQTIAAAVQDWWAKRK
ncbi:MAG: hypothetical protein Q8O76_15715 [Chloroflexota bacterium]|nr:hypothetical protein [Chloroflexota bacterium]